MSDHREKAEQLLEQSANSTGDPTVWLLAAQVHATLCLAEQQRLHTMALLFLSPDLTIAPDEWDFSAGWGPLTRELHEGLGL